MVQKRQVVIWTVVLNVILSVGMLILLFTVDHDVAYIHLGPSRSLYFVTIHVNTWSRWSLYMSMVGLLSIIDTYSHEYITPFIFERTHLEESSIHGFTSADGNHEIVTLCSLATGHFLSQCLRTLYFTLIMVSQLDVALWNVLIRVLTYSFIAWHNLTFKAQSGLWAPHSSLSLTGKSKRLNSTDTEDVSKKKNTFTFLRRHHGH